jgi:threonine dehydratase
LLEICAANDANVIEVQHVREGVKLHPRETGIQVVLEVKNQPHSQSLVSAIKSSDFEISVHY